MSHTAELFELKLQQANLNGQAPKDDLARMWQRHDVLETGRQLEWKPIPKKDHPNFKQLEALATSAAVALKQTPNLIIDRVRHMTWEDARHFLAGYLKSQNPWNLKTEGWRYRTAAVVGSAARLSLNYTGIGAIPVLGGGIKMSVSVGGSAIFYKLGEIDIQNEIKKINKMALTDDEKKAKIEEFKKTKMHQVGQIKRGLAFGLGLGSWLAEGVWEVGGKQVFEAGVQQAQMVLEGAQHTNWAEVSANALNNRSELGESNIAVINPKVLLEPTPAPVASAVQVHDDQLMLQTEAHAVPESTPEGYELKTIEFDAPAGDPNQTLMDTGGLVDSYYRDQIIEKAKLGQIDANGVKHLFNAHDVKHLELTEAEIKTDPNYQKKLAAAANYWVNYLNNDYAKAFSMNKDTGVYGEVFTRVNKAGVKVKWHNIDWKHFFEKDWEKYYTPEAEKIVAEAPKTATWIQHIYPDDPLYKDLSPEDLKNANFADTDINPAQLHSVKGFAEDVISKQVESHPQVDFNVDGPEKEAALADMAKNPLHDLEVQSVETQFDHDNTTINPDGSIDRAVIYSESGNPTEFFYGADKAKQATDLNFLTDYSENAKSLASLVDQDSLNQGMPSGDFWKNYTLNDFVSNSDSMLGSLQAENAINIKALAEMVLAKESGIDIETLRQQVAEDPALAAKLEKLIAYLKVNNADVFKGDQFTYKSPISGLSYSLRLPKEEALKKVLALF